MQIEDDIFQRLIYGPVGPHIMIQWLRKYRSSPDRIKQIGLACLYIQMKIYEKRSSMLNVSFGPFSEAQQTVILAVTKRGLSGKSCRSPDTVIPAGAGLLIGDFRPKVAISC